MTARIKKALLSGIAGLLLAAAPAMPAMAADITADTTLAELRANESFAATGFDSYEKGILLRESGFYRANETLREYVGDTADAAAAGLDLLVKNYEAGVQVTHKLYTPEEIAADPSKDKAALFYFPANTENAKYAIVLSGNMSEHTARIKEGCGAASQLHEMGYAVFVLQYSTGLSGSENAALAELARSVRYVTDNAEALGVQAENYAVVGFSAGGQLAGLFGTEAYGYKAFGVPRPGALILAYPINDYRFMRPVLATMFDGAEGQTPYYDVVLSQNITPDYPPTYHWFGKNDLELTVLGKARQGLALDSALEECGVLHKLVIYNKAPHGSGVGTGTDAEGWLYDAAAFWEQAAAAQTAGQAA